MASSVWEGTHANVKDDGTSEGTYTDGAYKINISARANSNLYTGNVDV
jgi:hypothetical protein